MLSSESRRRWIKIVLAAGISVFFTALFIRSIDLDDVGRAIADANYAYVVPAMGLFALSVGFRSLRWRFFLLPSYDLSWQALLPSVLIGYAGNNLLPLRAGEIVRAQHLSERFGVARMQTLGALFMERLFDGFVLALFLLWGLLLAEAGTAYLGLGLLLGSLAAAGFVACLFLAGRPGLPQRIAALPIPLMTPWLRSQIAGLGDSFLGGFSVMSSPSRFFGAAACSALAWGLELAMYWLIAEGFSLHASFVMVAFAGAAANVSLSIPAAQGGVGAFELFATEALLRFDIPQDAAAAYALALHFFLIVPVSLIGLAVIWRASLPAARAEKPVSSTPAGPHG